MNNPVPDAAGWQRIAPYLDRALDLASHQREAWLSELATTLPDIAAAVRSMVAERDHLEQRSFLAHPLLAAAACATPGNSRVGAYELERHIGSGGMGEVWSARRCDGRFEAVCAIKFLAGPAPHAALTERFRREGQLLARLAHPNIARLLDAGATATGQPYLALEYVDGQRIDVYCAAQALSVAARIQLCVAVAAAVAHAHSHLVIHRDIKPSNVLVTRDGQVKLLDFGVAKLLNPDPAFADEALTRVEDAALTPEYAAPEQMLGEPASTATDVYQLGMLLYVLLTEKHPLPASGSRAERIRAALEGVIRPPSQLVPAARRKQLQGDLDAILGMALRAVPAERYATAQALQDDLQRYLQSEPVLARRGAAWYHVRKFSGRHRVGVLVAGVALAALLLSTSLAIQQMLMARAQRDAALLQGKRAGARSELAEFMMADADNTASGAQRLDRARAMVEQRFAQEPLLQAGLLINLSGRYVDIGDSNMGTRLLQDAEVLARQLNDAALLANISCGLAFDAINAKDSTLANRYYAQALEQLQHVAVVSPDLQAECAIAGADIARSADDTAAAVALLSEALLRLEQAGMQRTARYTSTAHALARVHLLSGHYREAWRRAGEVMSIVAQTGRGATSAYQATLNIGTTALLRGGQPHQAVAVIETAIAAARQSDPAWEPMWLVSLTRAMAQSAMGDGESRSAALMRYADMAQAQGSPTIVVYQCAAVRDAIGRGDLAAAEALWSPLHPLIAQLQAMPERQRDTARLLLLQAQLELARQHPQAAQPLIEQAAALIGQPSRAQDIDPEAYAITALRADVALALRDFPTALRHAQLAVAIATDQAINSQSSASIGAALLLRARAEAGRGATAQSAATARQALVHLQDNLAPGSALLRTAQSMMTTPDRPE